MRKGSAAFSFFFPCVLNAALPQTVWGAEMVAGVGGVGEAGSVADMAAGQNQLAV